MENILTWRELDKCITEPVQETKEEKIAKCKAYLCLSVDKSIQNHLKDCNDAAAVWKKLKSMFEDKGLSRRINLLKSLTSTRLENSDNVQNYVDEIKCCVNKLNAIGFKITDEWITSILLAGLTEEFNPFIMGIEASGTTISSDVIMSKLIDSYNSKKSADAFFMKKGKKSFNNKKCYKCSEKWYKGHVCGKNEKNDKKNAKEFTAKAAFIGINETTEKNNKTNHVANKTKHEKCDEKIDDVALLSVNEDEWYIDSGCGNHMTPFESKFKNTHDSGISYITSASKERMKVKYAGNINLQFNDTQIVEASNVLYIPNLVANLLSVHKIVENGNTVSFNKNGCIIRNQHGQIIASCKPTNGTYKLKSNDETCLLAGNKNDDDAFIWHRRLGHINYGYLQKMRNSEIGVTFKVNNDDAKRIKSCEICPLAKLTKTPFKASNSETKEILELIHSDVCGPMETQSIGEAKYMIIFMDDFSHKIFCYFLHSKDQVFNTFVTFRKEIEKQTGKQIKMLRTDNGGEYICSNMKKHLQANGIVHQTTIPYTPEQNGKAERMNRTLIEKAKCLLFDAGLPKCYWAEAISMAAFLTNKTVTRSTGKIPDEIFHNKKVNISDLKIFGSKIMVHIPKNKRKKLDKKAQEMVFVGYDANTKGYRCIDKQTRALTISRDVKFIEGNSYNLKNNKLTENFEPVEENPDASETSDDEYEAEDVKNITTGDHATESPNEDEEKYSSMREAESSVIELSSADVSREDEANKSVVAPLNQQNTEPASSLGSFIKKTRSGSIFGFNNLVLFIDPTDARQATTGERAEQWKAAMQEEMNSHAVNNTWTLVELPKGKQVIKCRWIFKTKRNESGEVYRYKARLVAKGYSQVAGIDYNETYAPVVRYNSIRLLIAFAVQHNYRLHQMDVITAYLQGNIEEELYMSQPEGYGDGTQKVCKLNRAIYGLKQAGRQWNVRLDDELTKFGMVQNKSDPCVYADKNLNIILCVYVDDFLILYNDNQKLNDLKYFLNNAFRMKDMGAAKSMLGMQIVPTENGVEINQTAYTWEILHRFEMENCKPVGTPRDMHQKLSAIGINDKTEINDVPYQQAIGCLLFLSKTTRPDICFAVHDLSRFNQRHTTEHWNAVKRIFRYLKGTVDHKLRFAKGGELHAFTDADFASDDDSRKSVSGYVIKLANASISWSSKRQSIVAQSSTEAEYIAMSHAAKEIIWTLQLMSQIMPDTTKIRCCTLFCDNQSAMRWAEVNGYKPGRKHIDIRYHYVAEQIKDGKLKLEYVSTNLMTADSLTKAVTKAKHTLCAQQAGVY